MTAAPALLLDAVVKKCTHSILIFAGVADFKVLGQTIQLFRCFQTPDARREGSTSGTVNKPQITYDIHNQSTRESNNAGINQGSDCATKYT